MKLLWQYYSLKGILKVLFTLFLLFMFYLFIPVKKGNKTFYLPNSSIDTLLNILKVQGYGISFIDHIMLNFHEAPPIGWYTLNHTSTTRFSFFSSIEQYPSEIMSVKIFGGETSVELTGRLANDLKLEHLKLLLSFQKYTFFMEGDLLAGRYSIARKANEEATIASLFQRSKLRFESFIQEHYDQDFKEILETKAFKDTLTIASIIQKESYHSEDMYAISSVIYNRLAKNMRLQMDGTLNYGRYSREKITSQRIKNDTSSYNSYKHKGLPPTPLCTVTPTALHAALKPISSDYLYFMLTKKGTHDFSVTYKEHLKKIRIFREKPKELNDKKKIKGDF